jgi:hypothetical protein
MSPKDAEIARLEHQAVESVKELANLLNDAQANQVAIGKNKSHYEQVMGELNTLRNLTPPQQSPGVVVFGHPNRADGCLPSGVNLLP